MEEIDNKKVIETEKEIISLEEDTVGKEVAVAEMIIEAIDKEKITSHVKKRKNLMRETIDDIFYLMSYSISL